jgi:hypothetical protein
MCVTLKSYAVLSDRLAPDELQPMRIALKLYAMLSDHLPPDEL